MLFSIHCLDGENQLQSRLKHYDAHRAYLNSAAITIVLAGPVTADDGETPLGSVFIVDARNLSEVREFNQGDPFYRESIWDRSTISIHPFIKRRGWLDGF